MIVEVGKSNICRLQTQEELMLQLKSKCGIETEISLSVHESFSPNALTDWMRPTHIMKSSLLYLKSTDLNVNLI